MWNVETTGTPEVGGLLFLHINARIKPPISTRQILIHIHLVMNTTELGDFLERIKLVSKFIKTKAVKTVDK